MGAVPYAGGVTFRVWAPFASSVSVAGDFNDWSTTASALAGEGNGYWSADVPGAAAGHEYKFVIQAADGPLWRIDPYAYEVTSSVGNAVVYQDTFDWGDDGGYRTPTWDELVVYELHVGTFNDEPGGAPGGFGSVVARLDYLRDLGVTAIEVMPSAEFATDFSWGYNPSHIFAVEQAFGGPDGLKRLVRAAHERGIAVIGDVVYNHFGPSDLDLWRFDGWSANGLGGIYFYNDWRCHTDWGDTRPDYGREQVVAFLRDNARMWLESFRFDGLRWDATAFIRSVYGTGWPHDIPDGWRLMQTLTADTDARQPWKLHVAEDLQGLEAITRPTREGGAGFDSQWDAGFVHPVRAALTAITDGERSMTALRDAVARGHGSSSRRVIYTESHDEVANGRTRLPTTISPANPADWFARKRSTLGAVLVFTSPGIPMIFQGQEHLEDHWFHDEHPIDWDRQVTHSGIVRLYRDLVRLRRNRDGTTGGLRGGSVSVHHVNDDDKVIAYHRWDRGGPGDDVVVVANVAHRSYQSYRVGLPRPGRWRVRFNSDWEGYGSDFGGQPVYDTTTDPRPADGMPCSASLGLAAYSAVVLSQDA